MTTPAPDPAPSPAPDPAPSPASGPALPQAPGPTPAAAPSVAPADADGPVGTDPASRAAPPSRRAALVRSSVIIGVLVVVFGLILPQYVDYGDVVSAFRDLTPVQLVAMSGLGIAAWVVSGAVFAALIEGLRVVRGTLAWLILAGIGASVPLGPWNMGVLWVVVRGWGIGNAAATSGIALYGVINILSRMFLPLLAVAVIAVSGDLAAVNAGPAWTIAIVSAIAFVLVTGLIVAIVRSQRIAAWIGRTGQRIADWLVARLRRPGAPDVDGAVHTFRDQLGHVIRRRGLAALALAVGSQIVWSIVLLVALRICGVSEREITAGQIFGVYALVMVVTILPIAPGGAGVPELLFISAFMAITGGSLEAEITAGVFLYRIYFWFVPIPLAWILMKVARRGKSILPTTAELRDYAKGGASA